MPEDPMTPFSQGVQAADSAINSGMQWGQGMADLGLRRQMLNLQQQNHDEQKRQFNVTVGKQLFDDMGEIVTNKNGPLKQAKLDSLQQFAQESGISIHPEWFAALKDEDFSAKVSTLVQEMNGVKLKNPDAVDNAVADYKNIFGNKPTQSLVDGWLSAAKALNVAQIRGGYGLQEAGIKADAIKMGIENTNNRFQQGQTTRDVKAGSADYDKYTKTPQFQLMASARLSHIFEDAEAGKYKTNAQLLSNITSEYRRMISGVTGGQVIADAAERRSAADSLWQNLRQRLQYLSDNPQNTVNPAWVTQMKAEVGTLTKSYMNQFDLGHKQASSQYEDVPNAKRSIDRAARSFRSDMSSDKMLKSWQGPNQDGVTPPEENNTPAPAKASAKAASGKPTLGSLKAQYPELDFGTLAAARDQKLTRKEIEQAMGRKLPDDVVNLLGIK